MPSNRIPAAVVISLAVAYLGSARADDPPKQSDAEIKKLLVGKWSEEMTLPNGAKGKATTRSTTRNSASLPPRAN